MTDGTAVYQCVYVLSDGNRLWQGQLTGSQREDLAMVRSILKSKELTMRARR